MPCRSLSYFGICSPLSECDPNAGRSLAGVLWGNLYNTRVGMLGASRVCSTPPEPAANTCGWRATTSTGSMRLESEPLRLPRLPRCPARGVSRGGGCLLPRPPRCGQVRSAACARTGSAPRGRHRTRNRMRRRAAGIARTRSAAAAMRPYSVLRTASAPCAAHPGASICTLEEWGPPG